MEAAVQQHLHSLTLRTLHAHSFNRSSSQAAHALTDILARYISLLALTAKQYAEQSGRDAAGVNVWDVVEALSELGVSVDELEDFMTGDGKEMSKYGLAKDVPAQPVDPDAEPDPNVTAAIRRLDSLADIKAAVSAGLQTDPSSAFTVEYRRVPSPFPDTPSSTSSSTLNSPEQMRLDSPPPIVSDRKGKGRAVDFSDGPDVDMGPSTPFVQPPLVFPPSPISNPSFSRPSSPSSHPNKRARHASWTPPDHIPDFLPPFPGAGVKSQDSNDTVVASESSNKAPKAPGPARRAPLPLRSSNSKASYTKPIAYSKSNAAQRFGDLPDEVIPLEPPALPPTPGGSSSVKGKTSLQPLIAAYHVLQTDSQPATNSARLRVAHLLATTAPSKYTAPDTLFADTSPPPPRFAPPTPTHPVAIPPPEDQPAPKPSSLLPLPKLGSKAISESFSPMDDPAMPWLRGNLDLFTRELLPDHLYAKITTLNPPPPLRPPPPPNANSTEPPEPLLYHKPVPAPWNTSSNDSDDYLRRKDPKKAPAAAVGRETSKRLPEANLFATWDWTSKVPEEPLVHRRGKARAGTGLGSLPPTPGPNGMKSPSAPFSKGFIDSPISASSPLFIKNGGGRRQSLTSSGAGGNAEHLSPIEVPPRLTLR